MKLPLFNLESPFCSSLASVELKTPRQKHMYNQSIDTERSLKTEPRAEKKINTISIKKDPTDKSSWSNEQILLSPVEYPSDKHPMYETMADKVDILNQDVSDGWEQTVSATDLKAYKKKLDNDEMETVRIDAIFENNQAEAFPLLFFERETRLKWDKEVKEFEEIEVNHDERFRVVRIDIKPPIPMVSKRENLLKISVSDELDEKHAIFMNADSTTHNKVPERKDVPRADSKAFWYVERISEKKVRLVVLLNLHPKGSIPGFVVKKIPLKMGAEFPKKIKEAIKMVDDVERRWNSFKV